MEPVPFQVILTFWPTILKLWPSLWTFYAGHWLETINNNCFRAYQPVIRPVHCWIILTFELDITITLKILSSFFSGNYKWQLFHIFSAYQTNMVLSLSQFNLFDFVLEIMTFDFEILFVNSFSAQQRGVQCQCYIWSLSWKSRPLTLKSCYSWSMLYFIFLLCWTLIFSLNLIKTRKHTLRNGPITTGHFLMIFENSVCWTLGISPHFKFVTMPQCRVLYQKKWLMSKYAL